MSLHLFFPDPMLLMAITKYHYRRRKCSKYLSIESSFTETETDMFVERNKEIAVTGRIVLSSVLLNFQIPNSADDK